MSSYEMQELIPIVAELTDKYTGKESTSVTYEKATQLMGAVLYCIREFESETKRNQIRLEKGLPAKEAYQMGYQKVIEKADRVRILYNEFIPNFHSYGNENYQETVGGGIPGFLKYYDARFAPQDTIITMDYPTICEARHKQGIDAIEDYVKYISLEQKFLGRLPEYYVIKVLTAYQQSYRKQFYNICNIVLRHFLGRIFAETRDCHSIDKMTEQMKRIDSKKLEEVMYGTLKYLIETKYDSDEELHQYLKGDIRNFCVDLKTGAENNCLNRVIPMMTH